MATKRNDNAEKFKTLLDKAISAISSGTLEEALRAGKSWISPGSETHYLVSDHEAYTNAMAELVEIDPFVSKNFSIKTINQFLENEVIKIKKGESEVPKGGKEFFEAFHQVKPKSLNATAPLSGIRLDGISDFAISVFTFGHLKNLKLPIANDADGMYVSVEISDVYDKAVAMERAEVAFVDLARLVIFLAGRQDRNILIETGLPLRHSVSREQMYVSTSSYQMTDASGAPESASIGNRFVEKIPINHEFFANNPEYSRLWELYARKHRGGNLTDLESRILSSALSLGESVRTSDPKNSIIYKCIALETIFSYDEGSLFQKSIGEKLGDMFAFLVGTNKKSRLQAISLVKNVYRMRSAIVHGGDKKLSAENLLINVLLKAALGRLLNDAKFKNVAKIDQLYDQLKDAQVSY